MAGEAGRSCWSRQTVAVIFLLCTLAQSLTCFSLRGLSKKAEQDKVVDEAAVLEVGRGSVLFDEGELDSESGSAFAAPTEISEQTSQLKDIRATEAAWRRLNPILHCGKTKMTLKAMGPGAAHLQLDMGNARPRPLSQVPETCGYSMQQNALRLILVVPYDGCNVIQENGNYVLPMSWQETPVKLTCPMSPSPVATPASATPKRSQYPWKLPSPHRPWSLFRHKRQATQPLYTYNPYLYYYYMYMMNQALTTAPPTTTAKPDATTITTKPTTAKPPPAYPYYMYYPYYYYPYYPYYPLPNLPATTTVPPATTTVPPATTTVPPSTTTVPPATTTVPPATGPGTSGMTTTANMTTKSPQKPFYPFYPPYYPLYPYYNLPGQQLPGNLDNPEIYYYPIIQHFYGKPPFPGNPTTTQPPTTKAGDTAKPSDTSPTTKPTTASGPTTASAPTAPTTKPCCHKMTPSSGNAYPGPMSPYVSYYDEPFKPYVSFNKAGKLPDYQKYMPQDGYKYGLQARAYPHSGSNYWQPKAWFPLAAGQAVPWFDWKNLQPKQA